MSALEAKELSKGFGPVSILRNMCLSVGTGEVVALLGMSGSGKSTFARLVCGSLARDGGSIIVAGKAVERIDESRPISYMPQEEGFWATLSVRRQLALVLRSRRARFSGEAGIRRLAEEGKLTHRLSAYPSDLSGGELRRLAFLRAVAVTCELLILDEPFSSVDEATEAHMQQLFRQYCQEVGCGVLLISHDFDHALLLADRGAVLHAGTIIQEGRPRELLRSPRHGSVLRMLGEINIWPARISDGNTGVVSTSVGVFPMPTGFRTDTHVAGRRLAYSVPHECVILGEASPGVRGTVESAIPGRKALRVALRNVVDEKLMEFGLPLRSDTLEATKCGATVSLTWGIDEAMLIDDE